MELHILRKYAVLTTLSAIFALETIQMQTTIKRENSKNKKKPKIDNDLFDSLLDSFFKKMSSLGGVIVLSFSLIGIGYKAGAYRSDVLKDKEISELKNAFTLEKVEMTEKHIKEVIELNNKINSFKENYEERKK